MTHEQADFDAIASLLAGAMLQEDAFALLPRRMNRNVRAFLDLYGGELPFHKLEEMPNEKISQVTLLDTQSLVTIKGMSKKTSIHVVDHHEPKDDLEEAWTYSLEEVGACTTILIEEIRQNNGTLSMLPATLLLLGIYEDTGSLSYANTTPRDLNAAAYLLERGASLAIANQYLNPPLSENQRTIYNILVDSVEYLEIHNNRIVLAKTDASDLNEEISSIAHKIRDLLDPDGLFLLVKTSEGIRLVARSSTDQIHVGDIARYFGGGGHPRAAAALVQTENGSPTLDEAYESLKEIIPTHVKPAITVAQIMSKDPLLITPETSAQEASNLMQRYGYEGYPVVDHDNIVGLLTRRAVDRTLSHKLNLSAASLMDAGEIYVLANQDLDQVQKIMTESGWGQIPVLNPKTKKIIGIVTRTDLLKALGKPQIDIPGKKNLASKLNSALPAGRVAFLQLIAHHAFEMKSPVYIVGGFVRDLLLDRPGIDFDIVVEGDAIALGKVLLANYGGKLSTHRRFGTAKWDISKIGEKLTKETTLLHPDMLEDLPASLDLISARTEFYEYPSALPKIERSSIKLDLHRRDFSINTLALRLDGRHYGELYDYWGGLADLRAGIVRVLHSLSFVDDPTRLIRAVRFEKRFDFKIEKRTIQLMNEALDLLEQVSGDRLRHELNLILQEVKPIPALLRLRDLHLLSSIHPDLSIDINIAKQVDRILRRDIPEIWSFESVNQNTPVKIALAYIVWFGLLTYNPRSICKRLRMQTLIVDSSIKLRELLETLPKMIDHRISEITAYLETIPQLSLYAYYQITSEKREKNIIDNYLQEWQHIRSVTDGNDLREMGILPGPHYRIILSKLRNAWLDKEIHSEAQENSLLEELIAEFVPEYHETTKNFRKK